jgi:uncharacterized protein (TIGR00725 family)
MAYLAISGPGRATPDEYDAARHVGRWAAEHGHIVVCGGLGGVMEAAARGATDAGGTSVGLLPGDDRDEANPYLTVALPTALGEIRNALVVRCADVVICIGGSWGTLSELALAVRTAVPVISLWSWDLPHEGPVHARTVARPPVVVQTVAEAIAALDRAILH